MGSQRSKPGSVLIIDRLAVPTVGESAQVRGVDRRADAPYAAVCHDESADDRMVTAKGKAAGGLRATGQQIAHACGTIRIMGIVAAED